MSRDPGVLILYNTPATDAAFAASEAGVLAEVQAVAAACKRLRRACRAAGVTAYERIPEVLAGADETVVFNLVEGFASRPEQVNHVPALCAAFDKACTGNSSAGLLLSLDKWQSKAVLRAVGWPCPEAVCIPPGKRVPRSGLFDGPYLVKPLSADASEGIDRSSVVSGAGRALDAAVRRVHERCAQPALVEQFIDGRELNVSVLWRGDEPEVLPLAEIDFSAFEPDRPRIVGYEAKWQTDAFEYHHTPRIIPAPLPQRLAQEIRALAAGACRALGCYDYCRVDLRLDAEQRPFILEVNANPDISPDAGFAAALEAAGIAYHDFVRLTLDNARKRQPQRRRPARRTLCAGGDVTIRRCEAPDRTAVLALLAGTRLFRPGEFKIAREVLDNGLRDGAEGHYQSFVAIRNTTVLGWVCFGPTPCTLGTYDLYWIAVDTAAQGQDIGRSLMAFAEANIGERGGRRVIVETSGRAAYEPTQRFYQGLGYAQVASIDDFYDIGDAKVIFVKEV